MKCEATLKTITRLAVGALMVALMLGVAVTASAADKSAADVKDRMIERRAIGAAVWGMPIVNFQAMLHVDRLSRTVPDG